MNIIKVIRNQTSEKTNPINMQQQVLMTLSPQKYYDYSHSRNLVRPWK